MLLAVMGSGSHLKRRWDETEFDRSRNQHIAASTSATESARSFSIDPSPPIRQRLPPGVATNERPSQILREPSWTRHADLEESFTCGASPQPHIERSTKRNRLFYDQKESAIDERFDFESLTAHSSVRTSAPFAYRDSVNPLLCLQLNADREYISGLR